jgi:hypothetical protein
MWLKKSLVGVVLAGALAMASAAAAQEPAQTPESRIDAVRQSLVDSKAALKSYEWVETVALSMSGEEKVRQQYRCYYGAEGALQRVPVAADAKEEKKRGVRGKMADSKKQELEASLKAAVQLLHQYAPLDPAKLQAAKAAGNISVSVPGADGRVQLTVKNYHQPGDVVGADVDVAKNTLGAVSVTTSMEQGKEKSPVAASVSYAALGDGTLYPAKQTLEISAQNLKVEIQNSGYRKQAQ